MSRCLMTNISEGNVNIGVNKRKQGMHRLAAVLVGLGLVSMVAAPAAAEEPLVVGANVGMTVPQLFGDFTSFAVAGVEVGYRLPFDVGSVERPLQMGVDVGWTSPGAEGTGTHPMLGTEGGSYEWALRQQTLIVGVHGLWRFFPDEQALNIFASIGPRLYLMETRLNASDGEGNDFGENREVSRAFGLVVGAGAEYELGPGALTFTLNVGGSPLDSRITGEANTGSMDAALGYRLFF